MGVTAANVPSFRGQASLSLGDLQDLVEVVKALMLQADAPPGRVRTGAAKAVPVHDPPEGGVYFNDKFYEKNTYFRPRPGLVQDMAFATRVTEPCFVQGHGLLPLAQTVDDSGTAHSSPVAGGVAGVRYTTDSSVDAPRILPGGIIELPMSGGGVEPGECPLAEWGTMVESPVAGLIGGLGWVTGVELPYAEKGNIYFPMAETVDASGVDRATAIAGAIAGVQYATDSSVEAPRILPGGIIELPRGGGVEPGGESPLAQWGTQVESPVAGLIGGLDWVSGVELPYAKQGTIYFPLAETVDESGNPLTSAVAGAIAGVQYTSASSVEAPRILPGGILELPTSDGALKGIEDANGVAVDWATLYDTIGGKLVASYQLPTTLGNLPIFLYVGINGGFLTFALDGG